MFTIPFKNRTSFIKYIRPDRYDAFLFIIIWILSAYMIIGNNLQFFSLSDSLLRFCMILLKSFFILFNVFVLIPTFFNGRYFLLYFLFFLGICALHYPIDHWLFYYFFPETKNNPSSNLLNYISLVAQQVTIISSFFLAKQYVQFRQKVQEAEKEKVKAELNYLQAQINPHFYFNTLNNLYGLALLKSDKAPDAILKLSEIMEYIIYDCKSEKIELKKEIDYLKNYIELEKLRLEENAKVQFERDGTTDGISLAPLILLPPIENAFKHSSGENVDIYIKISIDTNKTIRLLVKNTFDKELKKGGFGIDNLRKRLAHLYPNKHHLELKKENNYFIAKLVLHEN